MSRSRNDEDQLPPGPPRLFRRLNTAQLEAIYNEFKKNGETEALELYRSLHGYTVTSGSSSSGSSSSSEGSKRIDQREMIKNFREEMKTYADINGLPFNAEEKNQSSKEQRKK